MGAAGDGMWSVGPDEDFAVDVAGRTAARPLGEGLRVAEADGRVAVSKSGPPLEAWVAGEGAMLDGEPALVAVAEALDAADVYSAMIVDGGALGDVLGTMPAEQRERMEELTARALVPFDVLGAGLAFVDGEPTAVLTYHHPTADAAAENAERLAWLVTEGASVATARPFTEMFDLRDIAVEGEVVTMMLGFEDATPANLWPMVMIRELLTAHL